MVKSYRKYTLKYLNNIKGMQEFLTAFADNEKLQFPIKIIYYVKDIEDSSFYILQSHIDDCYWQLVISFFDNKMTIYYWNNSVQYSVIKAPYNRNKIIDCFKKGLIKRGSNVQFQGFNLYVLSS